MKTYTINDLRKSIRKVGIKKALLRAILAIPSLLTGIWLVVSLLRKDRQCPHDIWSGTMLLMKKK